MYERATSGAIGSLHLMRRRRSPSMQSVTIHMSCARAGVSVSRYLPSAASPGVARCRSHLEVFVRGERDERAERNDVWVTEVA